MWREVVRQPSMSAFHHAADIVDVNATRGELASLADGGSERTAPLAASRRTPGRRVRARLREAQQPRPQVQLASGTETPTGQSEEGQQDEIHMRGVRSERTGKPDTRPICSSCHEDGEGDIVHILAETEHLRRVAYAFWEAASFCASSHF